MVVLSILYFDQETILQGYVLWDVDLSCRLLVRAGQMLQARTAVGMIVDDHSDLSLGYRGRGSMSLSKMRPARCDDSDDSRGSGPHELRPRVTAGGVSRLLRLSTGNLQAFLDGQKDRKGRGEKSDWKAGDKSHTPHT